MNQFRLSLLGPFEASLDDGPLTGLRSSKGRGLLAFLASRPGFPHLRETLATLLWGEATDEAARLSLRVALSNLRAALGPLQDAPDVHPLLETTRHHVRFNADPARCRIDAVEFDALLATCAAHTHAAVERCPACIERLSQAVNLYRGDFLADLIFPDSPAFDEWRVLQQERYHRQTLMALGQIAHYHLALGEYSAEQAAARRQLELEPWHEEAHRLLMRSLALDGQRHAALAQYEAAQRILASQAWFAGQAGRLAEADQWMQEGLALLRSQDAPDALAFALGRWGALALHSGEYHEARQLCQESLDLYCLAGNRIGMAMLHGFMGQLALEQGQYDEAKRHSLASLDLARRQGNRWRVAFPLSHLAKVAVARGDFDRGQALLAEALAIRQERSDQRGVAMTHLDLGDLDLARGDPAGARRHYGHALGIFWRLGHSQGLARALLQISTALAAAGQSDEGFMLLALLREQGEALQRFHELVERQYAVLASQTPPERLGALLAQARAMALDTAVQHHVNGASSGS